MLAAAYRSIAAADEAFDVARRTGRAGAAVPLRVDISSGGIETGAAIVRRLRRTRPEVAIEQIEVGVRRGIEMLRRRELDAVLAIVEDSHHGLLVELVRREPVLVAMAADHPLAGDDAIPVARLAEVDLLLPSQDAAAEWVTFVYDLADDDRAEVTALVECAARPPWSTAGASCAAPRARGCRGRGRGR
jgi:hypothetical protein